MILDTIGGLSARGRRRRQGAIASGNPIVEDLFSVNLHKGNASQQTIVNNIGLTPYGDDWTFSSTPATNNYGYYTKYVVPPGVTSLSMVGIGGGGGALQDDGASSSYAGHGGDLRYTNNIPVSEGDIFDVEFVRGNTYNGWCVRVKDPSGNIVLAAAGGNCSYLGTSPYISNVGDGGGDGGLGQSGGYYGTAGGGAGGYSGGGGNAGVGGGGNGSGGGGGGGDGPVQTIQGTTPSPTYGGSGGNTALNGQGTNGAGGTDPGGSGGTGSSDNGGNAYGGGAGINATQGTGGSVQDKEGRDAGVRIIGNIGTQVRTFPSTNVGADTSTIGLGSDNDGLVWIKDRDDGSAPTYTGKSHFLYDTIRGNRQSLSTDTNTAETTKSNGLLNFKPYGFEISTEHNVSNKNYVSWTFKKQPKFFDIVEYTGDGTTTKTVPHNLGTQPGMVIWKCTSDTDTNWTVWHRNIGLAGGGAGSYAQAYQRLSGQFTSNGLGDYGNSLIPTATELRVPIHQNSNNPQDSVNVNGRQYVAYVFAHNENDGEFGVNKDQDIIKCGNYYGAGTGTSIFPIVKADLGFEPQFVMIKCLDDNTAWILMDSTRGLPANRTGGDEPYTYTLRANRNEIEDQDGSAFIAPEADGFSVFSQNNEVGGGNKRYIYMAIRRPMATPTSAEEVFDVTYKGEYGSAVPTWDTKFVTDFGVARAVNINDQWNTSHRLLQGGYLKLNSADEMLVNSADTEFRFDFENGWGSTASGGTDTNRISWNWKRAPGFFDTVMYNGNGNASKFIEHGLSVVPEMMWIKKTRNGDGFQTPSLDQVDGDWIVYHQDITRRRYVRLNHNSPKSAIDDTFFPTDPTSTRFYVGSNNQVNGNTSPFMALLFATLPGISKVGSYIGNGGNVATNGTSQTIDCGFTTGARFVLIKDVDSSGLGGSGERWYWLDTNRGIVSGNDPFLSTDGSDAQIQDQDIVDPDPSGFIVNQESNRNLNVTGTQYIFYAIA